MTNALRHVVASSSPRQLSSSGVTQLALAYKASANGAVAKDWKPKSGYVYTQVRAISARINQNYDAWPSEELKKSYRTFIGKPVFVNHQNFDPEKARGKVVAARYVEAGDDKYVDTIMEVDAQRFPKLAKEIREGGMDSVSMGVEAGFTICSACGNKAHDEPEFCDHVRHHKGEKIKVRNPKTGKLEDKLVWEDCYKLGFFELSYVFDPADETAVVSRVMVANHRTAAADEDDDERRLLDVDTEGESMGGKDTSDYSKYPTKHPVFTPSSAGSNTSGGGGGGGSWGGGSGGGSVGDDGIMDISRPLYDDLKALSPDATIGGYRPGGDGYDEHNNGALDFMTTDHDLAQQVIQKGFDHGAPWAIWQQQMHYPDGRVEGMPDRGSPTQNHMDHVHTGPLQGRSASRRLAYGETTVPEDIDTLRNDDNDSLDDYQFVDDVAPDHENPFHHYLESPPELNGPNFDETKRLDRQQEADGLDDDRLVEDFGGLDGDPEFEDVPPRRMTMGRARTAAPKRVAESDPVVEELEELVGEDLDGDGEAGEPEEHQDAVYVDEDGDGTIDGVVEDDEESDEDCEDSDEECPEDSDEESGEDVPPWLAEKQAKRRTARTRRRARNKGKSQKGAGMSLAKRAEVNARGRRQHQADNSGHTDGGPYGHNDQGDCEEVYLSETPGAEAVATPNAGEQISNTEGNLVASIKAKSADLQREIQAYKRLQSSKRPYRATADFVLGLPAEQRVAAAQQFAAVFKSENPRFSPRKFFAAVGLKVADAVETPDKVDPSLSGTDDQSVKGKDFDDVALDKVETQPKDASLKAFAAFDKWIQSATGRTATAHNPEWLRRQAARWASSQGINVQVLYPTLGKALRQARKGASTNERAAMTRRTADESLEVAAPGDRIDVEAPVKNVTDADAQASQYDLGDFGHNAGDDLADPELSSDTQIWAPGEGSKSAVKKASGVSAVRYAESAIRAGLAPESDRWKLARQAETMREATVLDRTRLLEAVVATQASRQSSAPAGVSRGSGLPRSLTTSTPRTASTNRVAANDPANDSAIFF